MTTRERLAAAWDGRWVDHIPLTLWCFGFRPPAHLRWRNGAGESGYWYTQRLEHIHTLPVAWSLEDDFRRVTAW